MNRRWGCAFWARWLLANVLGWTLLWIIILAALGLENASDSWSTSAVIAAITGIVLVGCLALVLPQRAVLRRALSLPDKWTTAYFAGLAVGSLVTVATLLAATFLEALRNIQEVALVGLAAAWLLNGITQWLVIVKAPRAGWLVAANAVNLASGGFLTLLLIFIPLAMAGWYLGESSATAFAYVVEYSLIGAIGGAIGGLLAGVLAVPFLAHYRAGQPLPAD